MRLTVSVELPKTARFLPDCCLSSVIAPATSPLTSLVFCQSADSSELENTTLGMLFIRSAMTRSSSSAAGVGQ